MSSQRTWNPARLAGVAGLCVPLLALLTGCERDSFIDPAVTGRWEVTPTTVPILERLVAIEGPAGQASIETTPVRPEDLIPEVESYRVGAGDGIEIKIQDLFTPGTEETFSREVDPRGFIDLPRVGRVLVDGLVEDDVRQLVGRTLAEKGIIVKDPVVSVSVPRPRKQTFSILGGVQSPGLYAITRPDYRLLDALTGAGRFSENVQSVYIIRYIPLTEKVIRGTGPRNATSAPDAAAPSTPSTAAPAPLAPAKQPDNLIDLIDELSKPGAKPDPKADPKPEEKTAPAASPKPGMYASRQASSQPPQNEPPIDLPGDQPDKKAKPAPAPIMPPDAKAPSQSKPAPEGTAEQPKQPAPQPAPQIQPAASDEPERFWVFRDGKWIQVSKIRKNAPAVTPSAGPSGGPAAGPGTPQSATPTPSRPEATQPDGTTSIVPEITPDRPAPVDTMQPPSVPGAEKLVTQRVLEVPMAPLLAGSAQFNVVIRPGDVIRIPSSPEGVVYVQGEVNRPGVFGLPGNGRLTLKRAIVAAGGLSNIAIPERVDLTRMVGPDRQATIRLNLRAVEEGTMPDIFLKSDDVVNVGTNFWAFPLAVMRSGFRASYGYGFVLDRNFDETVFGPRQGQ